ncbi:MAG: hypothetical protein ACK4UN_07510, partial [Limisphaerales bacterium]
MRSRISKASFFWQGLFILLPVFFLAGLGIYSLRQDKETIKREAASQVETIIKDLEKPLWRAAVSGPFGVGGAPGSPISTVTFRDVAIPLAPYKGSYVPPVPLTEELKILLQQKPHTPFRNQAGEVLPNPFIPLDSPLDDPLYQ